MIRRVHKAQSGFGQGLVLAQSSFGQTPVLPIALWMSRSVPLYSRSDPCKAGMIVVYDHNGLTERRTIMKLPGPDHPITITANPKRVRVSVGGVVIADT